MIRRPPRSTHCISSAASDVYKRQTPVCTTQHALMLYKIREQSLAYYMKYSTRQLIIITDSISDGTFHYIINTITMLLINTNGTQGTLHFSPIERRVQHCHCRILYRLLH
eukprot:TRINITY_DN3197_c0_g4_i1.p1 TRINITY_DN3197_c0_g4~~TRINITY_DN3197_c0_g4_i1.p1  ORF type:complete len:117 (+),score=5.64 TRINITY_DN3197_c0_g4_i1:23-352(+)